MPTVVEAKVPKPSPPRDPGSDDQMIALALAKLAIERPGWLWTLRGLADARGWRKHFDDFYSIYEGEDGG